MALRKFRDAFKKARDKGKKIFKGDFSKSAIDKGSAGGQKTAGNLEFSTMTKKEVDKKIARQKRDEARATGKKSKAVFEKATGTKVSSRGQAFAKARKEGRDSFTFEGKSYSTRLKGEKKRKFINKSGNDSTLKKVGDLLTNTKIAYTPELSGKTSKKIKKIVRGNNEGFGDVSARKGGLIQGFPRIAKRGY